MVKQVFRVKIAGQFVHKPFLISNPKTVKWYRELSGRVSGLLVSMSIKEVVVDGS